jgi:hypothetical protein
VRSIKCPLSPTLIERADVDQHISERTSNALRFLMNMVLNITCVVALNSMCQSNPARLILTVGEAVSEW